MNKLEAILEQYKKSIKRLEDVLEKEKDEFIRDSAIQRFEFVFDLSWKSIKAFLEEDKGLVCRSPKECFKEAYQQKLVEYDDFWLELTDYRNQTVHTYKEELADEIYSVLPKALEYFKKLLESFNGGK